MSKTKPSRSERPGNKRLREEKEAIKLRVELEKCLAEISRLEKLVRELGGNLDNKPAPKKRDKEVKQVLTSAEERELVRQKFATMRANWGKE